MDLEQLTVQLRREGYRIWAHDSGDTWHVSLACSVEVLPASVPRPHGSGVTLVSAIQEAIICRNEIVAGLKKGAA